MYQIQDKQSIWNNQQIKNNIDKLQLLTSIWL